MKCQEVVLVSFLLMLFLLVGGCNSSHQSEEVESLIQNTKAHFISDSRVDRFEVETLSYSDSLVLKGETTLPKAKKALFDSLAINNISAVDSIEVLPSSDLEGQIYGLVNNSVGNIRSESRHSAQLVTQALLGMPVKVLKKDGGWYLVQTPDDYLGWIDGGGLERMDEAGYKEWKNSEKLIYLDTYGFSFEDPSASSQKVSDLVAGNILRIEESAGSFYGVSYPDGRKGFIPANEVKPFSRWENELQVTQESLVKTAETMIGAPYLWGGTSTKGMDCSGFTKTIYFMNGMIIPRDASQQVHAGKQVDTQKDFDKLQVGDLLFFGRPATDTEPQRVVHVGMWIGNNEFIHSAGRVHISSVDSTAENFDAYNVGRYLEARRYLDNLQGNIIQTAHMYDLDEQ